MLLSGGRGWVKRESSLRKAMQRRRGGGEGGGDEAANLGNGKQWSKSRLHRYGDRYIYIPRLLYSPPSRLTHWEAKRRKKWTVSSLGDMDCRKLMAATGWRWKVGWKGIGCGRKAGLNEGRPHRDLVHCPVAPIKTSKQDSSESSAAALSLRHAFHSSSSLLTVQPAYHWRGPPLKFAHIITRIL